MKNQQRIKIDVIFETPAPMDEGMTQLIKDLMGNALGIFSVLTYLVRIVDEDLLKNPKFDPSDELYDVLSIAHKYLDGLIANNKIDKKSISDLYRKIDNRRGNFDNVFQDM